MKKDYDERGKEKSVDSGAGSARVIYRAYDANNNPPEWPARPNFSTDPLLHGRQM